MSTILDDALGYIGLGLDEVRRRLGPEAEPIPGDEYRGLDDVTSIENESVLPGTLYLRDGAVELIYLGDAAVGGLTRTDLAARLGDGGVELRSRAGKRATLVVHAEQGVAFSAQGDTVDFVEVFRPRSQAAYETDIYVEPPAFIR